MGLFLEMGHILFCAYYDKTLTPASRVLYASASRAIMVCWREKLLKARCVGKHFITSQSYDDFLASVDGLVWYILSCVSNFPKADIVPWYLTSDSLEQLFAWLRTGMHAGRKTDLDAVAVLTGCGKRNLSLTLDADGLHLLEHSVAHTRGRQMFKMAESQDAIIYKGNQTCKEELMEAIKEGEKLGQSKFDKYAGFTEDMYVASDPEDTDVLSEVVEDESTWTDATPNAENQVEDISVEFCDEDPTIMSFSNGKQYHIDYAVQKYCNDGRTTMSGQSRVRRFQVVPSSKLTLKAECPRGSSGCLVMYIGAVGTFGVTTKGRFGKKRKENKKGKILFIARAESDTKSVYRSSVNYRPLNTACSIHNQLAMFVKGECGQLYATNDVRSLVIG